MLLLKVYLLFFLSFLSLDNFGQLCYANFEGIYDSKSTNLGGISWDTCIGGQAWNGTIRFESVGSESIYKVFSTDDLLGVELEDMLKGAYYICYEVMDQNIITK